MLVMTKRGLSFGVLSLARTTSALMMMRRCRGQVWRGIVGFAVDVLGLAAVPREPAGLPHGGFGLALQHRVFGHGNDVLKVGLGIQKVEQFGMREAAVEANPDTRTRKAVGDHIDQTTQDPWLRRRRSHCRDAKTQPHTDTVRPRH